MGEQRTKIFNLINDIESAVNKGNQIADLLLEGQQLEQFDELKGLLNRLGELNCNLDMDKTAIDNTLRQHGDDEATKRVLAKHYKQIRGDLEKPDAGPSRANIAAILNKLEQAQQQHQQQEEEQQREERDDSHLSQNESSQVQMLEDVLSAKDPITKRDIREPVKNSICGHIYDRTSIYNYIEEWHRNRPRQLCQCPVRLCANKTVLQMPQMVPYPEFFKLIRQQRRRSMSRERTPFGHEGTSAADG